MHHHSNLDMIPIRKCAKLIGTGAVVGIINRTRIFGIPGCPYWCRWTVIAQNVWYDVISKAYEIVSVIFTDIHSTSQKHQLRSDCIITCVLHLGLRRTQINFAGLIGSKALEG